ncbi:MULTISPECIES: DUF2927 domain-containing protein [unclassified Meridianimarinicoccus]|uniref:DUF2927 domain-containing protein n=1 Tax=unclassified Meridianimarinicoccus TaxID=2923344 RepID=UPI0018665F5C|nr:DUF2927 domain-containing protein [Fluviibacterium sp. MJW13]
MILRARLLAALAVALLLSACAQPFDTPPAQPSPEMIAATRALPPMKTFGAARPEPPRRSNTELARDFIDLTMKLENGESLPVFTRFSEPVTIALTGDVTPIFRTELSRLVTRIRREAGVDLRQVKTPNTAAIVIEAIARADLQSEVPAAACFVLPRHITWAEFSSRRRISGLNWSGLTERTAATIFIPADVSPQEIRDCLHEETAQALGPVNDLYRLEDSIFNDDNMHSVLTGFDMLILKATYDPAVRNGMSAGQLAAVLPGVLDRINPAGRRYATRPYAPSTKPWLRAIDGALTPDRSMGARRNSATRALELALDAGWDDTRLGLSFLTSGRLAAGGNGPQALEDFFQAGYVYQQRDATAIHGANVGIQISAFALATGEMDTVLRLADKHIPAARQAENAALLADFLLVKAAALDALGRTGEASATRRDGYGWARYGLRSDADVLRRAAEIDALVPRALEGT